MEQAILAAFLYHEPTYRPSLGSLLVANAPLVPLCNQFFLMINRFLRTGLPNSLIDQISPIATGIIVYLRDDASAHSSFMYSQLCLLFGSVSLAVASLAGSSALYDSSRLIADYGYWRCDGDTLIYYKAFFCGQQHIISANTMAISIDCAEFTQEGPHVEVAHSLLLLHRALLCFNRHDIGTCRHLLDQVCDILEGKPHVLGVRALAHVFLAFNAHFQGSRVGVSTFLQDADHIIRTIPNSKFLRDILSAQSRFIQGCENAIARRSQVFECPEFVFGHNRAFWTRYVCILQALRSGDISGAVDASKQFLTDAESSMTIPPLLALRVTILLSDSLAHLNRLHDARAILDVHTSTYLYLAPHGSLLYGLIWTRQTILDIMLTPSESSKADLAAYFPFVHNEIESNFNYCFGWYLDTLRQCTDYFDESTLEQFWSTRSLVFDHNHGHDSDVALHARIDLLEFYLTKENSFQFSAGCHEAASIFDKARNYTEATSWRFRLLRIRGHLHFHEIPLAGKFMFELVESMDQEDISFNKQRIINLNQILWSALDEYEELNKDPDPPSRILRIRRSELANFCIRCYHHLLETQHGTFHGNLYAAKQFRLFTKRVKSCGLLVTDPVPDVIADAHRIKRKNCSPGPSPKRIQHFPISRVDTVTDSAIIDLEPGVVNGFSA